MFDSLPPHLQQAHGYGPQHRAAMAARLSPAQNGALRQGKASCRACATSESGHVHSTAHGPSSAGSCRLDDSLKVHTMHGNCVEHQTPDALLIPTDACCSPTFIPPTGLHRSRADPREPCLACARAFPSDAACLQPDGCAPIAVMALIAAPSPTDLPWACWRGLCDRPQVQRLLTSLSSRFGFRNMHVTRCLWRGCSAGPFC